MDSYMVILYPATLLILSVLVVFVWNAAGKAGRPHANQRGWSTPSYHTQKQTQNTPYNSYKRTQAKYFLT